MIPIRVEVTYSPTLSRSERLILNMPNKLKDLRPFMVNQVAPAVNEMLQQHWDSKGAAFGHKWAPWSERTLMDRLRKGTAGKGLLRDTDHLFQTLFRSRATDSRLRRIKNGLRLSLNVGVPYAVFHQVGTSFMPDRQIIPDPLPVTFMRRVRGLFREYLTND